jgi:hypothetical protein
MLNMLRIQKWDRRQLKATDSGPLSMGTLLKMTMCAYG